MLVVSLTAAPWAPPLLALYSCNPFACLPRIKLVMLTSPAGEGAPSRASGPWPPPAPSSGWRRRCPALRHRERTPPVHASAIGHRSRTRKLLSTPIQILACVLLRGAATMQLRGVVRGRHLRMQACTLGHAHASEPSIPLYAHHYAQPVCWLQLCIFPSSLPFSNSPAEHAPQPAQTMKSGRAFTLKTHPNRLLCAGAGASTQGRA